jgi:hypothetical protein
VLNYRIRWPVIEKTSAAMKTRMKPPILQVVKHKGCGGKAAPERIADSIFRPASANARAVYRAFTGSKDSSGRIFIVFLKERIISLWSIEFISPSAMHSRLRTFRSASSKVGKGA